MTYTAQGVVSFGFPMDDTVFTYLLSGSFATDLLVAATAGFAVELDTSAASTVKLATDGGRIFGRVFTAENRGVTGIKTASVQRSFKEKLPAALSHGIVVGDHVVGGGAGLVRKAITGGLTPDANYSLAAADNVVVEVGTDFVVVEQL